MHTSNSHTTAPPYNKFDDSLADYLSLFCIAVIVMLLGRATTYLWVQSFEPSADFFGLLGYSLRWDGKLLATWGLLLFILVAPWGLIPKASRFIHTLIKALNKSFLLLICLSSYLLSVYWQAIGHPFDNFIFGIVNDETEEILKLIWNEYNPIKHLIIITIVFLVSIIAHHKWKTLVVTYAFHKISRTSKIIIVAVLFIILVFLARGSVSLFPLSKKTTHFSRDTFINELSINAPNHLYYALKEKGKSEFDGDPASYLRKAGYGSIEAAAGDLLFTGTMTNHHVPLLVRSKSRNTGKQPNIIFILMESWSSHILFEASDTNDLLGAFKEQQHKGALFTNFLSTRLGTSRFIESTLLNTSLLDVSISAAQKMRLQYSNIQPLLKQGYDTYFISGGARSWLNHDAFWRKQGIKDYWDMTDIMDRYNADKHSDWGVHDEHTLAFTLEKARQLNQEGKPFFMFVITTSNHPPHSTPENYPLPPLSAEAFNRKHLINPDITQQQLATFRYSTDQLGLFLKGLSEAQLDEDTIVVATGDHVLRSFYQYVQKEERILAGAVPCYIQVPERLMQNQQWDASIPASHRDIFPTLFELALPNAEYLKTGFNLLNPDEPHGAWYEYGIWLTPNEASFAADDSGYSISSKLRTLDSHSMSEAMQRYRRHTKALEALLEWQLRQEYMKHKAERNGIK